MNNVNVYVWRKISEAINQICFVSLLKDIIVLVILFMCAVSIDVGLS